MTHWPELSSPLPQTPEIICCTTEAGNHNFLILDYKVRNNRCFHVHVNSCDELIVCVIDSTSKHECQINLQVQVHAVSCHADLRSLAEPVLIAILHVMTFKRMQQYREHQAVSKPLNTHTHSQIISQSIKSNNAHHISYKYVEDVTGTMTGDGGLVYVFILKS